jgi:argininosuccinate lyase
MTLWGGRFTQTLDSLAWDLNSSLPVDQRMAIQDVDGSLAWADAIHKAGILSDEEHEQITRGLVAVRAEFASGQFSFAPSDEDIHTAVERRLTELIGVTAGKLHTGRSRNDQVATDFRLWMLQAIPQLDSAFSILQSALLDQAKLAGETLMPGYTHLQRAQPILLSHWWLSHFHPLQRDRERLADLTKRISILPLGCGALAGTPVPVDRAALAESLGYAFTQQPRLRFRPRLRCRVFILRHDDRSSSQQTCGTNCFVYQRRVWLLRVVRCVFHRLQSDAAKEKSRCL